MTRSIRIAVMVGLLAALVAGTSTVVAGDESHDRESAHSKEIIETRLVGIPSSFTNVFLAGVKGAGHAWAIKSGEATLRSDGRLDLKVRGLVLTHTTPGSPAPEGTNPILLGRAIVSCNGGTDIVLSDTVNFSVPNGNAHVKQRLTLPSQCLAPTIFFGNAAGTSWFAVSG